MKAIRLFSNETFVTEIYFENLVNPGLPTGNVARNNKLPALEDDLRN